MPSVKTRVLLLGGTGEAARMAQALAAAGVEAVYSYAGRTDQPRRQPLPTRIGGFGGAEGLARTLRNENFTDVIDATHPFAQRMSENAIHACAATGTRLLALERAPWVAGPQDDWRAAADIAAAVKALPKAPARVFLAIGRQNLTAFKARPEHFYVLRLIDRAQEPPFDHFEAVYARGPFTFEEDRRLLRDRGITHLVAKNAGGDDARAKLLAAADLRLPVIMIARPKISSRPRAHSIEEAMAWLIGETRNHGAPDVAENRGA